MAYAKPEGAENLAKTVNQRLALEVEFFALFTILSVFKSFTCYTL